MKKKEKLVISFIILLLIGISVYLIIQNKKLNVQNKKLVTIFSEESQPAYREMPYTLFDTYDNPYRPFAGFKTEQEIVNEMGNINFKVKEMILKNYKEFKTIAGYYLPIYTIDFVH